MSLQLGKRRKKKRLPEHVKRPLEVPAQLNVCWSLDFLSDALTAGRRFRTLNVVEDWNREVLGIEVDFSLPATRVVALLTTLVSRYGAPPGFGWTMSPNLSARCCRAGARASRLTCPGFSPPVRPQTPTWNALTALFAASCSTPTSLPAYVRCANNASAGSMITIICGPTRSLTS